MWHPDVRFCARGFHQSHDGGPRYGLAAFVQVSGLNRAVERGVDVCFLNDELRFGNSAAAPQHLNMARVRAVETDRFVLRATNTGLTAVVDPRGRILAQAPQHERAVLTVGFAHRRGKTFFVRFGDWFPALCVMITMAALVRNYWLQATEVT